MEKDWYEHRSDLRQGQVFRTREGGIVRLDHAVPGDATKWQAAEWWGHSWAYMESTIEPGDLDARLPDNWSGLIARNGNIR